MHEFENQLGALNNVDYTEHSRDSLVDVYLSSM